MDINALHSPDASYSTVRCPYCHTQVRVIDVHGTGIAMLQEHSPTAVTDLVELSCPIRRRPHVIHWLVQHGVLPKPRHVTIVLDAHDDDD